MYLLDTDKVSIMPINDCLPVTQSQTNRSLASSNVHRFVPPSPQLRLIDDGRKDFNGILLRCFADLENKDQPIDSVDPLSTFPFRGAINAPSIRIFFNESNQVLKHFKICSRMFRLKTERCLKKGKKKHLDFGESIMSEQNDVDRITINLPSLVGISEK